jgi:putative membrane protein
VEAGRQPLIVMTDESDTPQPREADARFLLANERTLLAWIRTALTIIAGGVGVQQFGHVGGRRPIAIVLIAFGAFAATAGTIRYHRADRAIRAGRLPPAGYAPTIVSVSVVAIAVVLLVAILT